MGPLGRIVLALALAASGCSRETPVEAAARRQALYLGNGAEPKDFDPAATTAQTEYTIDSALFEGLVNVANDGRTILPGAAERWEVSADGRTYLFHLRPELRWSDGSPLTAEDFAYSFRRVFLPTIGSEGALYGFAISGSRELLAGKRADLGVREVDRRTLEIRLDHPAPYFPYVLSGAPFQPVPKSVVERFGGGARPGTAWIRPGNLVSNGPFKLGSWRPNQDLVAVANPFYWDHSRMRLREVRFFPIDSPAAEERAYRAGQLAVTFGLPLERIEEYRRRRDPALRANPLLCTSYLVLNATRRPFDDVRIRRAFALAIDRDRLIPLLLHGAGTPAHSLTRPGTAGYEPPAGVDFDPKEARRLLAQAGFPGGTGFPPVSLRFSSGYPAPLYEAIQEEWGRELGIRVALQSEEERTFFDRMAERNFEIAAMRYFYGVNAPEMMLIVPEGHSSWNQAGWRSPAYDLAYREATSTEDPARRRAAFDRMERLIRSEAAYVPLYFNNQVHLVSPIVRGWRDNPLGQIDWRELSLEGR